MAYMDKFKVGLRFLAPDAAPESVPHNSTGSSSSSPGQAHALVRRPSSGSVVSVWTCSKICAVTFVIGVFVGFTLKRRLKNWARKLLKRMKDD